MPAIDFSISKTKLISFPIIKKNLIPNTAYKYFSKEKQSYLVISWNFSSLWDSLEMFGFFTFYVLYIYIYTYIYIYIYTHTHTQFVHLNKFGLGSVDDFSNTNLEQAAKSIGLYVNSNKTKFMCFKWQPLKLVDQLIYLSSNLSSTESDVSICLGQVWTTIERWKNIRKSDTSDKIKWEFFQAEAMSALLGL